MTPQRIIITGATGGIGRALVREYARPGGEFLLLGRNNKALNAACDDAEKAGAKATSANIDVTDHDRMEAALGQFHDDGGVDLLLLSAGVKVGNRDGIEPVEQLERVLSVNLTASMRHAQAVLPHMQARMKGQIVFFSSLSALSPQPDLLSYSASKAALRNYAVALRRSTRGTGVTIHVVTPGFVDTPMTDRHLGHTPMKISAERAAKIIRRGLARGRTHIAFPLFLVFLVRLQNLLPPAIADGFDRAFRADIVPDDDERAMIERENGRKDQSQG